MSSNAKRYLNGILENIRFHHNTRVEIFQTLSHADRAQVLLHLTKHIQHDILGKLTNEEVVQTLEYLDPDQVTDVLQSIDHGRQKKILPMLSERLKNDVQILFEFDPETAAGIMSLDYIQVEESEPIAIAAKKFKTHEKRTGRLPVIIITREGKLNGYLPGHELAFGSRNEAVRKYMRHMSGIKHDTDKHDVLDIFKTNPHNKVAVIGENGGVIGIIYSDDVLRLIEENESSSLYDFAGVQKEESVADTMKTKVRLRYKWLLINLATAFLASFTVGLFDKTISKYVLLAIYMPIVAGMGGNAATQTLAVLVRGIALRQIDLKTAWPTLKREVGSGMINGIINGVVVATIVLLFNHDLRLALVLATAMVINLMVAGFFGTLVPLIMQRLGKDPATSATIFITTATDVLGFIAFLGLATLILR